MIAALVAAAAASAQAGNDPPTKVKTKAAAPIVFPVVGPVEYSDDFGDPRGQGRHDGNDILAPRRALAVAAEGGKVSFWTTSRAAGCMLYLYGDSGTTYLYIHLNNDLGDGNDNRGRCVAGTAYAKGLKSGSRVEAGEVIGYVGDSGDANGIHPHLHFEVHPKGGAAVSPYPYLKRAVQLLFSEPEGRTFSLVLDGTVSATADGLLTVSVDRLREWPSHQHQAKLARTLVVSVPAEATVEANSVGSAQALTAAVDLTSARIGQRVSVWTSPAPATAAARIGADGALTATRVLLK